MLNYAAAFVVGQLFDIASEYAINTQRHSAIYPQIYWFRLLFLWIAPSLLLFSE